MHYPHRLSDFLLACLLACLLIAGCANNTNIPVQHTSGSLSPAEEIARDRAKLAEMKTDKHAAEAASDLEKAVEWLDTAKTLAVANPDSARVRLHLDAVKSQLIMVQAYYAQREAETAAGTRAGEKP